jgi:uncharacterized protein YndB with AHSA1/START domain
MERVSAMTRIYTAIHIPRSIETVFDYVTTPGNWPQWHPSSLGVSGATDHPLVVGEQVTEEYLVAGRQGKVVWTASERAFPSHLVIEGEIVNTGGNGGVITYTFSSQNNGTFFEREFVYKAPGVLFVLLDRLVIRRRIAAESTRALKQLKTVLTRDGVPASRTSSIHEVEK